MSRVDSGYERQDRDFYPTPEWVTSALLSQVRFPGPVWEPASGNGAMAHVIETRGPVFRSDIHPIADPTAKRLDFLTELCPFPVGCHIITNPPYGPRGVDAERFIRRALDYAQQHKTKVAMLLSVDFDSAKTRQWAFRDNPAFFAKVTLLSRIKWFDDGKGSSPSENHAWFVWDTAGCDRPRVLYAL